MYRYGVSRVYNQQCVYTLTDVQAMHDKMRTTFKIFRDIGLDPEAGKAKYALMDRVALSSVL